MEIEFEINGSATVVDIDPDMPLLWVIRDELDLKATKYGCGRGICGACSIHVDGDVVRSCSYPVRLVAGKKVTTLEGLSPNPDDLHPIQAAWIEENVPQCGYCQPGFMMAAAKLLDDFESPSDEDIHDNISNICRCGTQFRIMKAIHRAAELKSEKEGGDA